MYVLQGIDGAQVLPCSLCAYKHIYVCEENELSHMMLIRGARK
jgi:hypothetical protein